MIPIYAMLASLAEQYPEAPPRPPDPTPRTPREALLADLAAHRDSHPLHSREWRRAQDVRDLLWQCWSHLDRGAPNTALRISHVAACDEAAYLGDDALLRRVREGLTL